MKNSIALSCISFRIVQIHAALAHGTITAEELERVPVDQLLADVTDLTPGKGGVNAIQLIKGGRAP